MILKKVATQCPNYVYNNNLELDFYGYKTCANCKNFNPNAIIDGKVCIILKWNIVIDRAFKGEKIDFSFKEKWIQESEIK